MPARTDRMLTRLWLALAAPCALVACLHYGALLGARRWDPDSAGRPPPSPGLAGVSPECGVPASPDRRPRQASRDGDRER